MIVCVEGLDRTGKTTLVKELEKKGFKSIHFSAPDKKYFNPGYTGPSYAEDLAEMFVGFGNQNIVLDRSHYGEQIWSSVYNRLAALNQDDLNMLIPLEGPSVRRILMHDPDINAHWKRCVENKEPLDQVQFSHARKLFHSLVDLYNFEVKSLKDIPQLVAEITGEKPLTKSINSATDIANNDVMAFGGDSERRDVVSTPSNIGTDATAASKIKDTTMTPEQLKLLQANAINEVMTGRIVKKKGDAYDILEDKIRHFLNTELALLLGTSKMNDSFTEEDVIILKALVNKVKEKK
jgi:hypothetical protein